MGCCDGKSAGDIQRMARRPAVRMGTAAKGLARITVSELRGNFRPVPVRHAYHRICLSCPGHSKIDSTTWCGKPFVDTTDHPDPEQRFCGCRVDPTYKPKYADQWCPQGKWPVELTIGGKDPGQ